MKRAITAIVLICLTTSLYALPEVLTDERGWVDFSMTYHVLYPPVTHNGGVRFSGHGGETFGLGFSMALGQNMLSLTLDLITFIPLSPWEMVVFPVYTKLGMINGDLGFSVRGGVKWFFHEWVTPESQVSGEHAYFSTELLQGVDFYFYPLFGPDLPKGRHLRLAPVTEITLGLDGLVPLPDYIWLH
jgi:hypothetical protein